MDLIHKVKIFFFLVIVMMSNVLILYWFQSYPDTTMKKNVNKVTVEFEKLLNEEFPIKMDTKKPVDVEQCDGNKIYDNENDKNNLDEKKKGTD